MNEKQLEKMQEKTQSHYKIGGFYNEYNGWDKLKTQDLNDKKIYSLTFHPQIESLQKGDDVGIDYFFDQATYDKFVDPVTKEFDSKALSRALQVGPYYNAKTMKDGHAEYRVSIACFDVKNKLRTPIGNVFANNQFGEGGGHQCFIPKDEFRRMIKDGELKYNPSESLIDKGKNYIISKEEYAEIADLASERVKNCERQKLQHPEKAIVDKGVKVSEPIPGIPFDKDGTQRINDKHTKREARKLSLNERKKLVQNRKSMDKTEKSQSITNNRKKNAIEL